jgi:hypothetical protein
MSNALAIAGVTAVLRDLLDSGMIEHAVTDALGQGVVVTAVPPDTIDLSGANARPRLNLFLHQVTPNQGWRNVGLPARDSRGDPAGNPPLAVDLHYLLTAYGLTDLQAEILLGYGMQLLHENPVLTREAIRRALAPPAVNGALLPSAFQSLRAADLAEQLELIKVTPALMNSEEMSRLWSALQAHYRPTAAYHASVVLIESRRAARAALPVLTRGQIDPFTQRETGVQVQSDLTTATPTIAAVIPPQRNPSARLGDTITLTGHRLDGANRAVMLTNRRLDVEQEAPALAGAASDFIEFTVPALPADLPAATYEIAALVQRPGEPTRRQSNTLALTVAPRITTALPAAFARDGDGDATLTLLLEPEVRVGQSAALLLGTQEVPAEPFNTNTSALTFIVRSAVPGTYLARVRVDGIESLIIDRSATPPTFLDLRITVT